MTDEIILGNNSNEEVELVIAITSSLRQPEAITKICLIISLLRKALPDTNESNTPKV